MIGVSHLFPAAFRYGVGAGKLPLENRRIWRNSKITFNPERMRIR
jgi:hypothetical protein